MAKAIDRITKALEKGDGITITLDEIEITAEKHAEDPGYRPVQYVIFRDGFPPVVNRYDTLVEVLIAIREIAPLNRWSAIQLTSRATAYYKCTGHRE